MALSGDTWNDRMKGLLVGITGLIPPIGGFPVGKIISKLLEIFWPDSQPDIWSLIKDQVAGLIDQKILEYEIQERKEEMDGLQKTMLMYVEAEIKEKGSLLSTMIGTCNGLYVKLTQSQNAVQLIPLLVTHSTQHLLILKERLLHGKEMYDEDNTAVWKSDLEDQISSYKDYIRDIYNKWVTWRKSQITVDVGAPTEPTTVPPFFVFRPYGTVTDQLTSETVKYRYSGITGPNEPNFFKPICDVVKTKMFGSSNGKMLQILLPTFYLDNFIPGNEDNPSVIPSAMSKSSFGPISTYITGGDQDFFILTPNGDNTRGGDVTSLNVREWNIIDGFQVVYSTGPGTFYGNSGGGQLHEFPLSGKRVKSMKFCFNNCNQVSVTIGFSDGTSSGQLGNRGGWLVDCVDTGGMDTYGLYNIRATDNGCAKGLFQIALDYKAYPVRPSQLNSQESNIANFAQKRYKYASSIEETQCREFF